MSRFEVTVRLTERMMRSPDLVSGSHPDHHRWVDDVIDEGSIKKRIPETGLKDWPQFGHALREPACRRLGSHMDIVNAGKEQQGESR